MTTFNQQQAPCEFPLGQQAALTAEIEKSILHALRGLRYGQVTISIQEGIVTQVDRSEQTRHFRTRIPGR